MNEPSIKRLREYADNPTEHGFVPVSPSTLRWAADRLETAQALLNAAKAREEAADVALERLRAELLDARSKLALAAENEAGLNELLSKAKTDLQTIRKAFDTSSTDEETKLRTEVERLSKDAQRLREGWESIANAPLYVYGRDALVGEYLPNFGWKKVLIWEPNWARDDIISRGGTHWWPHLRDLPLPSAALAEAQKEKP